MNLNMSDLRGADLSEADLRGAGMTLAILAKADLTGANLKVVNIAGADLRGANFTGANLERANLSFANLREANLSGAILSQAKLNQADLAEAHVGGTILAGVDLSETKGLESVKHLAPSSIGIDTIYRSKGNIPHLFLRQAGVPDLFITFMPELVSTGIEFYSLFISYSAEDHGFAQRLHADLQARGVGCWFAPHDMRSGKKVLEQIDAAIRVYDKLLLILSPASMESNWVKTEIAKARKREVEEGRRILFPIRLCDFEQVRPWILFDSDIGWDLAQDIREYFIPDFSKWKDHDAYKLAFDRLLKDLQGKSAPPAA
jgi:hypothetical protein